MFFIPLLVALEVTVGVLVLAGGRRTQLGQVGAIGFDVGLVFFGWAFAAWSIPTIIAFVLLLRAERKRAAAPVAVEAAPSAALGRVGARVQRAG